MFCMKAKNWISMGWDKMYRIFFGWVYCSAVTLLPKRESGDKLMSFSRLSFQKHSSASQIMVFVMQANGPLEPQLFRCIDCWTSLPRLLVHVPQNLKATKDHITSIAHKEIGSHRIIFWNCRCNYIILLNKVTQYSYLAWCNL